MENQHWRIETRCTFRSRVHDGYKHCCCIAFMCTSVVLHAKFWIWEEDCMLGPGVCLWFCLCVQYSTNPVTGTWNEGSGAWETMEPAGGRDSPSPTQDRRESVPWPRQSPLSAASTTGTCESTCLTVFGPGNGFPSTNNVVLVVLFYRAMHYA